MIILLGIVIVLSFPNTSLSQSINWRNLNKTQKHIFSVNTGIEYGLILGAGYGYQLKSNRPIVLGLEYSFPTGNNVFDDFKTKMGALVKIYQTGNIHYSVKIQSLFRQYQSDFVRLINVGSDQSVIAGYYSKKWFVAGEAGLDKAIATHFKHSESFKEIYPMVRDGWYEPSTGGNFYYTLLAGFSFGKMDAYMKAGKLVTEDFRSEPMIPFTVQLGFNIKISR
jgi:hypothetical protein